MMIHTMEHYEKGNTFLKRGDILSLDKFKAWVSLQEQNIFLGWYISTRQIAVKLPLHKCIACSYQVDTVINRNTVGFKLLQ